MKSERQRAIDSIPLYVPKPYRKTILNIGKLLTFSLKDSPTSYFKDDSIYDIKDHLVCSSIKFHISDFEKSLSLDGFYIFNPKEESENLKERMRTIVNNYDEHKYIYWAKKNMLDQVDQELTNNIWKLAFSGIIPKRWEKADDIIEDFKRAREQKIQLSPMLVLAGITHCHPHVVHMAGITQELSGSQRYFIQQKYEIGKIARPQYEEILEAQGTPLPLQR